MDNLAYYNGTYAPLEELTLPVLDRAVYFGDGVYEAAYFRNGKPFALGDHMRRLENSLRMVKIGYPVSGEAELVSIIRGLCERVGGEGIVYWQVSRGTAPRGHVFPDSAVPNLLAWAKRKPLGDIRRPLTLITVPDIRYHMCNVKTLNLMPNIMAAQSAKDAGCDEAVFVRDGFVTEGAHTNVHIIKDGRIVTHENGSLILPGTVRGQLLSICGRLGIGVEERAFTVDEMLSADEVLITSATSFIKRACSLDCHAVGGRASALYERLASEYLAMAARECGE